jgi:nucleotide-binding universal stress UspA family protein
MSRYLVVAQHDGDRAKLHAEIKRRHAESPSEFHVVVPAHLKGPSGWTWTAGQSEAKAEDRLQAAIDELAALGVEVTGSIRGNQEPEAVAQALADWPADAVIVSSPRSGAKRALNLDLVSKIERQTDLPVIHVEDEERDEGDEP